MRTVQNIENITIKVKKDELLEERYLPFKLLSNKLIALKDGHNLRNRAYNSMNCNKYNLKTIAGIRCIDTKEPMAKPEASLVISFEKE